MRRWLSLFLLLIVLAVAVFWLLTTPSVITAADLPQHTADIANGERLFHVGGCASCHASRPANDCRAKAPDKMQLGGGHCLATPFGTFLVPNISSDTIHGIGAWSDVEFASAMVEGVGRDGSHLYPSFPYTSYRRMPLTDVMDLRAFLATLPAVATPSRPHQLPLPFQWRRGLGLWKQLYLTGTVQAQAPATGDAQARGAYLVNGPGHCGECHTPRNIFGGAMLSLALAGGKAPDGEGWIPNITQGKDGLASWSVDDINSALSSGMTPEGDFFGGSMVEVQENLARLPAQDRRAIAIYLKSLPAINNPRPR